MPDSVSLYRQIKSNSHLFFTMMDDASKFLIIRSIIVFADRFVSENYDKISLICDNNEDFFRKEIFLIFTEYLYLFNYLVIHLYNLF